MTKLRKKKKKYLLCFLVLVIVFISGGFLFYNRFREKGSFYALESRLSEIKNTSLSMGDSNYDIVGWLRIQDTNIDLPIVYGGFSPEYPVELEGYGWLYYGDWRFHNLMHIMGHNIFNLSSTPSVYSPEFKRFEELMSFVYFDEAKKSKYIQFTFNGKEYLYKVFSVAFFDKYDVYMATSSNDYTEEKLEKHIKTLKENSFYDYDVDVNGKDNILSIGTCTRFFENDKTKNIIVSARMVREGEEIEDYSIRENPDNYNKIKKILEGDENNEESFA